MAEVGRLGLKNLLGAFSNKWSVFNSLKTALDIYIYQSDKWNIALLKCACETFFKQWTFCVDVTFTLPEVRAGRLYENL